MSLFANRGSSTPSQHLRCLVVGDFEAVRKIIVNQLRELGVRQVTSAKSAAEALGLLRSQEIDVVLSDLHMPGMNGIEFLKTLRADEALRAIPFILHTAEVARAAVEEAVSSGVTAMLLRPCSARQLLERLERAARWRPRLPSQLVSSEATGDTAAEAVAAASAARPTILMVDDTPDNLLVLSRLFKEQYRVRLAQNGAKALEIMTGDDPPDLVMLDIMMPGMDGFEVARRMREHPQTEFIPIIFVTAMTGTDARLKGLDLGAVDYVTKPIDADTLKPRVRNFMRYVQMRKDLQSQYDAMVETAELREDVERILRQDIKEPLATALAMLQKLATDDALGHREIEQLRHVEEGIGQALDLVNLSSELYRIETGRFVLQAAPVPIGEMLRRIVEGARVRFAGRSLTIRVDSDVPVGAEVPQVMGDATLCHAIFQSLLRRACDAAPASSAVTVRLMDGAPLRVVVRNPGSVPAPLRARFFDKYVAHDDEAGMQFGAYGARMLAQAQGGTVALDVSDEEDNTTITVSLPRAPAQP